MLRENLCWGSLPSTHIAAIWSILGAIYLLWSTYMLVLSSMLYSTILDNESRFLNRSTYTRCPAESSTLTGSLKYQAWPTFWPYMQWSHHCHKSIAHICFTTTLLPSIWLITDDTPTCSAFSVSIITHVYRNLQSFPSQPFSQAFSNGSFPSS